MMTKDNALLHKMALECYGYGRWDAPFWFIGPEQGMGETDDIRLRVATWLKLGAAEVCDCREFHETLGDFRWHGTPSKAPVLQKT